MQRTNERNIKQQRRQFDLFAFRRCSSELPAAAVEKAKSCLWAGGCAMTRQGLSWWGWLSRGVVEQTVLSNYIYKAYLWYQILTKVIDYIKIRRTMYTTGCLRICVTFEFQGKWGNVSTVKYRSGRLFIFVLLWDHFLLKKRSLFKI